MDIEMQVPRKNENHLHGIYSCGWAMEEFPENRGWIYRNSGIFLRVILWLVISIIVDFLGIYSISGSGWDSASILRSSLGEISSAAMLGVQFGEVGADINLAFVYGAHLAVPVISFIF